MGCDCSKLIEWSNVEIRWDRFYPQSKNGKFRDDSAIPDWPEPPPTRDAEKCSVLIVVDRTLAYEKRFRSCCRFAYLFPGQEIEDSNCNSNWRPLHIGIAINNAGSWSGLLFVARVASHEQMNMWFFTNPPPWIFWAGWIMEFHYRVLDRAVVSRNHTNRNFVWASCVLIWSYECLKRRPARHQKQMHIPRHARCVVDCSFIFRCGWFV